MLFIKAFCQQLTYIRKGMTYMYVIGIHVKVLSNHLANNVKRLA